MPSTSVAVIINVVRGCKASSFDLISVVHYERDTKKEGGFCRIKKYVRKVIIE